MKFCNPRINSCTTATVQSAGVSSQVQKVSSLENHLPTCFAAVWKRLPNRYVQTLVRLIRVILKARAMNPVQMLNRIREVGGTVEVKSDDLHIRVHLSRLNPIEADWLQTNEQTLRALFFSSEEATPNGAVAGGYPYRWTGQKLRGEIGLDTETTLIDRSDKRHVPQLSLVSVSDGDQTYCLKPEQLLTFLQVHVDDSFILFNAAFDFFVIRQYLGEDAGVWRWIADEGRIHDAMILDQLISLAESDAYPRNRNLGLVAKFRAGMTIDKDDPYRLRYAELLHKD